MHPYQFAEIGGITVMKKRLIALFLVCLMVLPIAASAATYYRVNTSSLKLRFLPESNAQVLDSFRKDFALTVKKKLGDWSYVQFSNGSEGYVQNKYLVKGKSSTAYITSDNTVLHTGPAYNFDAVGTLARGAKVTVLTPGASYSYVKSSVGYGYVAKGYLSSKYVKPSGNASTSAFTAAGDYTAYVTNAGTRTVNFRSGASTSAPVIKAYAPGTEVYVVSKGKTWSQITVEGVTGYMMTRYLTTAVPAPTPVPVEPVPASGSYTAYITSPNTKSVNVHLGKGMSYSNAFRAPYASQVTVLEHGSTWDYIEQNGKKGYILTQYVTLSQPDPTPAPEVTPTPAPVSFPYTATVYADNGEDVNLRMGPGLGHSHYTRLPVGTLVTVLAHTNANWAKIQSGEFTGYIMRKFLR